MRVRQPDSSRECMPDAVGFDNIDIAAATARHIPVSNTPGVLTETTADMAWALLMGWGFYRFLWRRRGTLFLLGAVYSLYEGIEKVLHPAPLERVSLIFLILGVSVLLEGYSWLVAIRGMMSSGRPGKSLLALLKESKDANLVVITVEDTAAMAGLLTALVGTLLAVLTGRPVFDGLASIVIGLLLAGMSLFLASEMAKLLVGEGIDPEKLGEIRRILGDYAEIDRIVGIWSMQLGSGSCLIAVRLDFDDQVAAGRLEELGGELRQRILAAVPEAEHIFLALEPRSHKITLT